MASIAIARRRSRWDRLEATESIMSCAYERSRLRRDNLADRRTEILDERVDVRRVGSEAEDADAPDESAVRLRSADHHPPARRRPLHQRARRAILVLARGAGPGEMEGEQRQLRRRVDDDVRQAGDAIECGGRERPLLGDRRPKPRPPGPLPA